MLNDQTPKQSEKALNKLFIKYDIQDKITVEVVKKWIWNATGQPMEAVNKYHEKCFRLFPEIEDVDELNNIMQTFTSAWNSFPHKELGGKSPSQLINQQTEKIPQNTQKQEGMPKAMVGDREMEFDEFEAMLKEMEKAQKPFRQWIEKDALPKYKKYLDQMIKNKNIREDHYIVADIFFQRVLHVGFVDLEGIRPEFIWKEFPHWWPTHVMQSGLKPAHVKKYLKELFKFIDIVY